ncbi:MAG: hypothetical protein GY861_24200 [bacterium]|nr:hypothetical protein [bacterium]
MPPDYFDDKVICPDPCRDGCRHSKPHKHDGSVHGCNWNGQKCKACVPYKDPNTSFGGVEDLEEVECLWCGKSFIKSTNRCHHCNMHFVVEDK